MSLERNAIEKRIRSLTVDRDVALRRAKERLGQFRARGVNPATNAAAFKEMDQLYLKADRASDEIIRLQDQSIAAAAAPSHDGRASLAAIAARRFTSTNDYRKASKQDCFSSKTVQLDMPNLEADALTREETMRLLREGGGPMAATASWAVEPDSQSHMVASIPVRPVRLLGFVQLATTDKELVDFAEETTRTDVAAETAKGTAYAEASYTYEYAQAPVRDIGHWIPVHRSNLADVGQVQAVLEGRLGSGVQRRAETQIVSGDGTGQNFVGILNTSGIGEVDRDGTNSETRYETIHRGLTTVRLGLLDEPDAVLIHPSDYEATIFEKDGNGTYVVPGAERRAGTLWGKPAVISTAIAEGTTLVGNYSQGAVLWVRSGTLLRASETHDDYLATRRVALLAELRAAFAAWVPPAFATVDLS